MAIHISYTHCRQVSRHKQQHISATHTADKFHTTNTLQTSFTPQTATHISYTHCRQVSHHKQQHIPFTHIADKCHTTNSNTNQLHTLQTSVTPRTATQISYTHCRKVSHHNQHHTSATHMVDKFYTTNSNTDELYIDCKAYFQLHLMQHHFELGLSKHQGSHTVHRVKCTSLQHLPNAVGNLSSRSCMMHLPQCGHKRPIQQHMYNSNKTDIPAAFLLTNAFKQAARTS